uniref:Uncharacterized protein n=1 Tax=Timema poppense TaxID=170557 RepID=A0A7R9HBR6_TIMPO|nr:unnamed protein product [Timema poppensis]
MGCVQDKTLAAVGLVILKSKELGQGQKDLTRRLAKMQRAKQVKLGVPKISYQLASSPGMILGGQIPGQVDFQVQPSQLGMSIFLKHVAVLGISVDNIFNASLAWKKDLHSAIKEGIKSGIVQPLGKVLFTEQQTLEALSIWPVCDGGRQTASHVEPGDQILLVTYPLEMMPQREIFGIESGLCHCLSLRRQ